MHIWLVSTLILKRIFSLTSAQLNASHLAHNKNYCACKRSVIKYNVTGNNFIFYCMQEAILTVNDNSVIIIL